MHTNEPSLARDTIGTGSLFFFVIAAAAPLTAMAGFAPLAFLLGGPATPLGYLIAGAVYFLFSVGFLSFARHTSRGGAFYTYISIGLGRHIGLGGAWVAYVAYALGQIGFCAAAGLFTAEAIRSGFGLQLSWGSCAVTLAVLAGALAYYRIEFNAKLMAVLITAEIGILAIFSLVVFLGGGAEGIRFESLNPQALFVPGLGKLLVITFIVFIGFEQTVLYSEEARDPRRTVPRATYLAIGFLTVFYLLTSWSIYIAIGPRQFESALTGNTANLVFDLAAKYVAPGFSYLMLVLVLTSFFAGVLALQNASSRYLIAIAEEHMLPAVFATRNRYGMPQFAGIFQAVLAASLILLSYLAEVDPYTQLVVWTNTPTLAGVLVLQILTCMAVIRHFHANPLDTSLWSRLIAPGAAVIVLLTILALLLRDLNLLTGTSHQTSALMLVPLILAFAAGFSRSVWLNSLSRRDTPTA
ncbi:APC family permease [Pseudomonas aeruginosa]